MKEIKGNLWKYHDTLFRIICITTNCFVKKDGTGVMGRGCASEACLRIPGIEKLLGAHIKANGEQPGYLRRGVIAFPVKYNWWEQADLELIRRSATWLAQEAGRKPEFTFILPRPGCGNGRLSYSEVQPILVDLLPDNVHVIDFER